MTKVLEISGDGDYAAVSYEDAVASKEVDEQDLFNQSKEASKWLTYENEKTGTYFDFKAHEFGEIDPEFVTLVLDEVADYDYLKSHCIYVLEDE